jgi:hypothetical protein
MNEETKQKQFFTPGEWHQSHRTIPNDEDGGYATQVYDSKGETIATLEWYKKPAGKLTGTYRSGNARLIAEAPAMFEKLKEMLANLELIASMPTEWRGEILDIIKRIETE